MEGFEASSSDQFQTEIDTLQSQYESKRAIILENTALTEEQRTELEMQLTRSRNDQVQSLEQQRIQMTLQSSAQLFSGLASLTASAGAEQSGVYKVMFAASKAFAVADSIVSIQQGIAAASKLGFPQNLPAIANIVSSTAGVISTIQGTDLNFAGAYDKGGDIPQGSFGLVGEYGPELIKGPVNVTGREKTANLLRNSSSESSTQSGSTTLQVTQHITVTGNGDKALQTAMTQAAAKGTQDAYKLISNDLKTNRGVSKYVARRA